MKDTHKKMIEIEKEYARVYEYLDRYRKNDINNKEISYVNQNVKINKTVWILWFQGVEKAPKLVKRCIDSVKKNIPDSYEVVILDKRNINDYVVISNFVKEKFEANIITKTHFSDIIRVELLYMYGGCWIDATVFCSDKIPNYMLDGELFFFNWSMIGASVLKGSTWWLVARKGSQTIKRTREYLLNYWEKEKQLINYYLLHIIISRVIDEDSSCGAEFGGMMYVCNANPHVLYKYMEQEYTLEKWNIIKQNSIVHKLSYKRRFILGDINNFYVKFIEGRLS